MVDFLLGKKLSVKLLQKTVSNAFFSARFSSSSLSELFLRTCTESINRPYLEEVETIGSFLIHFP